MGTAIAELEPEDRRMMQTEKPDERATRVIEHLLARLSDADAKRNSDRTDVIPVVYRYENRVKVIGRFILLSEDRIGFRSGTFDIRFPDTEEEPRYTTCDEFLEFAVALLKEEMTKQRELWSSTKADKA